MDENRINSIVNDYIRQFKSRISDIDDATIEAYIQHLKNSINSLLETSLPWIQNDEQSIRRKLDADLNLLSRAENIDEIRSRIIKDKYFEELKVASNKIFTIAIGVLNGDRVDDTQLQSSKNELKKVEDNISKVSDANRKDAENLLSEAILDDYFISNPNSEGRSLRLGHYISEKTSSVRG